MNLVEHPAGQSIYFLKQGCDLLRRLDDGLFSRQAPGPFRGGVGGQFRHCLDFYRSFLDGIGAGRVDYSARGRDRRTETDRDHAIAVTEGLIEGLLALTPAHAETPLDVKPELSEREDLAWSRSTVQRELQFLVSHTIHHYALIVALLIGEGFDLGDEFADFGVAPSTLGHWETAGLTAGS
ncbi:MAG: DinB family protein [bacterium]|nr:DinB family protein [bacterium]